MMNKKFLTMMFSLLLAVGWTSSASAQLLPGAQERHQEMRVANKAAKAAKHAGTPEKATANQQHGSLKAEAPSRTQNYDLNATAVHPKSWYQALDPVTWSGGSQNITEPFTTAKGMMALLKRIYTDPEIPGAKYSAPRNCDIPYQTIQHGWDIVGTNYLDNALVRVNSNTLRIYSIEVNDLNGENLATFTPSNNSSLSGWSISYNSYGYYWYASSSSGASLTIPAEYLENTTGGANVVVNCFSGNYSYATTSKDTVFIGNQTFDYQGYAIKYSSDGTYYVPYYTFPGTITPPDENGYTVCLVKLYDGINMTDADKAPEYTATTEELEDYFTTYVKEIQLLTDGMRVASGTSDAGTVFAYTGDLNRFFFLSKGKMFYYSSIQGLNYDRAPFYSMYEEFSANDVNDNTGFTDFYEKMKQGTTYDIKHDCMGVNFRQHYFSMSGKQGTTENRVNSLVFYIPDNRGILNSNWREYDPEHLPTVGMYMIDLYAEIEPSETQNDYYTVTVNWYGNLDTLTHTDNIPQVYRLYEIKYNEQTGKNDTTLVYTGTEPTWHHDYPVGDPKYYDLHYYVVGTPIGENGTIQNPTYTNPDFFAKSNTDDVTIPGKRDILSLQWERYESDYVIQSEAEQMNYYRNWLAPRALSVQGQAGYTAGNVGTTGRTLTLYRNDGKEEKPIMDLDLIMDGNKAYYRIRYRSNTQQVEPGYDPQTGELTTNNNNN